MLTRRGFLQSLSAASAGMMLDPERLLWVPGAKTIFLPPPAQSLSLIGGQAFTVGDLITIEGVYAVNPITHAPTKWTQAFVVTADVPAGVIPESALSPRIIGPGHVYQNVSQRPTGRVRVQPWLVGRTVHGQGFRSL